MLQQAVTEYSCVFTKKPGTNFPDTVCSLINTDLYSHEAWSFLCKFKSVWQGPVESAEAGRSPLGELG